MASRKKQQSSLAHKVAVSIKKKLLAAAFVMTRREGFVIRVATIDGKPVQREIAGSINVDVVDGFVKRAWVS